MVQRLVWRSSRCSHNKLELLQKNMLRRKDWFLGCFPNSITGNLRVPGRLNQGLILRARPTSLKYGPSRVPPNPNLSDLNPGWLLDAHHQKWIRLPLLKFEGHQVTYELNEHMATRGSWA